MAVLVQIITLLAQLAPAALKLVLDLIQTVKDAHDGTVTAEQAAADAHAKLDALLSRLGNVDAEAAGTNAAVDAEAAKKFAP